MPRSSALRVKAEEPGFGKSALALDIFIFLVSEVLSSS